MISRWTQSALLNWLIWFTVKLVVFAVAWNIYIGPNLSFLPENFRQAAFVIYILIFLGVVFAFDFVFKTAGSMIGMRKK